MKNIITFLLLTFSLGALFIHAKKYPNERSKLYDKHMHLKGHGEKRCFLPKISLAWKYDKWRQHCKIDCNKKDVRFVACGSGLMGSSWDCHTDC